MLILVGLSILSVGCASLEVRGKTNAELKGRLAEVERDLARYHTGESDRAVLGYLRERSTRNIPLSESFSVAAGPVIKTPVCLSFPRCFGDRRAQGSGFRIGGTQAGRSRISISDLRVRWTGHLPAISISLAC